MNCYVKKEHQKCSLEVWYRDTNTLPECPKIAFPLGSKRNQILLEEQAPESPSKQQCSILSLPPQNVTLLEPLFKY